MYIISGRWGKIVRTGLFVVSLIGALGLPPYGESANETCSWDNDKSQFLLCWAYSMVHMAWVGFATSVVGMQ